jgi:hypothetical protein
MPESCTQLTAAEPAGGRFAAEGSSYAELISSQAYLLTGIPFLEVFTDNSAVILPLWPASVETGSYSPTATLTFQRTYGSRVRDLLLPSFAELAVGQELKRTADLSQTAIFIKPKIVTRAANLFGKLGSLPVVPFFRTDEYSMSVSDSLEGAAAGALSWSELAAEAYASLSGFDGEELTLIETFRREQDIALLVSSATQVLYDWRFRPPSGAWPRFLPGWIRETGYLTHRESAELTVRHQDTEAPIHLGERVVRRHRHQDDVVAVRKCAASLAERLAQEPLEAVPLDRPAAAPADREAQPRDARTVRPRVRDQSPVGRPGPRRVDRAKRAGFQKPLVSPEGGPLARRRHGDSLSSEAASPGF